MAGRTAAQQAPKQNRPSAPQTAKKRQTQSDFKEKLHHLPQAAGIALLCVMLVLALFAGNFRALQSATPKAFLRQGDVAVIVEERISEAKNVLSVAARVGLGDNDIHAVELAIGEMQAAKTARELSRANQVLEMAVSSLTTAQLEGEEARNMRAAADGFAEQGSFLRQEARAYNEKAQKAQKVYDNLPTRFLYEQPDLYTGL